MEENKNLIVYKQNIFDKIKNFFLNIFHKKGQKEIIEKNSQETSYIGSTKKKFNEYISFKEDKDELNMINTIRKNPEALKSMNWEELDKIENAIRNRQRFVDKKIAKLKTDLMMRKKGT